jgi:hypothetical protein
MTTKNKDDSDSDSDVAFAAMDFTGVDFDDENAGIPECEVEALAV